MLVVSSRLTASVLPSPPSAILPYSICASGRDRAVFLFGRFWHWLAVSVSHRGRLSRRRRSSRGSSTPHRELAAARDSFSKTSRVSNRCAVRQALRVSACACGPCAWGSRSVSSPVALFLHRSHAGSLSPRTLLAREQSIRIDFVRVCVSVRPCVLPPPSATSRSLSGTLTPACSGSALFSRFRGSVLCTMYAPHGSHPCRSLPIIIISHPRCLVVLAADRCSAGGSARVARAGSRTPGFLPHVGERCAVIPLSAPGVRQVGAVERCEGSVKRAQVPFELRRPGAAAYLGTSRLRPPPSRWSTTRLILRVSGT